MSSHLIKSIEIASKVTSMADDALRPLDLTIAAWPGEYRAIIWQAVADMALSRAMDARESVSRSQG